MVRVVRLERTVSWSQTRRDTNFAIPGYSLFCHDTTESGKNKDFSVCGHLCGQSRFYAVFNDWGKSRKRRRRKALRRFTLPCPGYRHGTPKAGALPTALHPVIQFFIRLGVFSQKPRALPSELHPVMKLWHPAQYVQNRRGRRAVACRTAIAPKQFPHRNAYNSELV